MSTINDKKPQLHASMLGTLSRCPIQFQRRYGARFGLWHEEEIRPPGIAAAIGSSVDAAVNYHMTVKKEEQCKDEDTKVVAPLDDVLQVARDEAAGLWTGGLLLSDEQADNTKKTEGFLIDWSVELTRHHYNEVADLIHPVDVQKKWVVILDNFPLDLSGTIDIVEPASLRDTKTTGNYPAWNYAYTMQAVVYNLAFKIETGSLPETFWFDVLVRKASKTDKIGVAYKPKSMEPHEKHFKMLFTRIERICEFFETIRGGKATFPAVTTDSMNSWICTKEYCGYWPTCDARNDW